MIRKYTDGFEAWLGLIDMDWYRPIQTWTLHGRVYDPEKYDLVPKDSYKKELTEQKDKELKELDSYYERKKKELLNERDRLLGLKSG